MLLTPPSTLEKYDVPEPVLEVLRRSAVKHVSIIGRRGPLEAAFTTKELREMMNLEDSFLEPMNPDHLAIPEGAKLTRQQSRTMQLLQKGSKNKPGTVPKSWSLDFFRSPTGFAPPDPSMPETASSARPYTLSLAHTTLTPEKKAVPTGETSTLRTSLVVTSLGHQAEPSLPWYDPSLKHVRTVGGRVVSDQGQTVKNVYASGWAAMGARGVLASTMLDAYSVADTILTDAFPESFRKEGDVLGKASVGSSSDMAEAMARVDDVYPESIPAEVEEAKRAGNVTDYREWKRIDSEEIRRGQERGKERERMDWLAAKTFLDETRTSS